MRCPAAHVWKCARGPQWPASRSMRSLRRSVSPISFTPFGRGKDGLSRSRTTLAISTSWPSLASSAAVVNVVRIVPPTA